MASFSVQHDSKVDHLYAQCFVSKVGCRESAVVYGVWDTGAYMTSISPRVAKVLNLRPKGSLPNASASGFFESKIYSVDLRLPGDITIYGLNVCECDLVDVDILIGMDIITLGDFAITNQGGKTLFSFRMPSETTIDFTK